MTKKKNNDPEAAEKREPKPLEPGSYDGELSPGKQWRWHGVGAPDDQWVATESASEEQYPLTARVEVPQEKPSPKEPIVTPQAASATFYITVAMTYPGGATQIAQATTYQVITPWGQSTACINLLDALNQMVSSGSSYSGQMWNYLANGVTRGLATSGGATVPASASYFNALP